MRHMVKTALTAQEAMDRLQSYFGPGGKGLSITSQYRRALRLEDDHGYVSIIIKGESPTLLEIDSRAWEREVGQFIAQLPQQRPWWSRWWRHNSAPTRAA